jgi:hypothetical protein
MRAWAKGWAAITPALGVVAMLHPVIGTAEVPPPPPRLTAPPALAPQQASPAPSTAPRTATPGLSTLPADAPASRWAADVERLDEDVRLRLLTPNGPAASFVRAAQDKADIASQVRYLTAARSAAPQDKLYLAALAAACLTPTQPVLDDCAAVDRLADWARRDDDNGLPSILLANRARQHAEADAMVAHLTEAATKPRFDDYWGQGALVFWDYFRALPLPFDPAAKAVAALTYAVEQPAPWQGAMQSLCANPRERANEALREACASVGEALARRSTTWSGRVIGVTLAYRNAATPAARARVEATRADATGLNARCDDERRRRFAGLESPDPAARERAIEAADAWMRAGASDGEVGGCEKLLGVAR